MDKKKVFGLPKKIYVTTSGYSYTNLGRLFLRLFIGLMLMQFGIRQIGDFEIISVGFPSIAGMGSEFSLWLLIGIEIVCSLFIMVGFLTRIMILPPFIAMIVAEYHLLHDVATKLALRHI